MSLRRENSSPPEGQPSPPVPQLPAPFDWTAFLRRALPWTIAGALLFGLAGGLYLGFTTEDSYRAQALVSIQTKPVRGDGPRAVILPFQAYLTVAQSRPTVQRLRTALREDGHTEAASVLKRSSLRAQLIRPERWEASNVLILRLVANAPTAEMAQQTVNEWAETFVELDDERARETAMEEVEEELEDAADRITEREVVVREELRALREQLATVEPTLELQTAVTDRELLRGTAGSGDTLISQKLNPVYTQLAVQLANLEMELIRLEPQHRRLLLDLETARTLRERGVEEWRVDEENEEFETRLGLKVKRALTVRGSSRILETADEAPLVRTQPMWLRVLAFAMGGAILGFLCAVGREVLAPGSRAREA